MNKLTMSTTKLIIPATTTLFEMMKMIDEAIRVWPLPLTIDMSEVAFPLTRDVFFVLAKRFCTDQFKLILRHAHQVEMAHSASITAIVSGISAQFDREYQHQNVLKHNFTMWQYFLYEVSRWLHYIQFVFTRKKEKIPLYKVKNISPNF